LWQLKFRSAWADLLHVWSQTQPTPPQPEKQLMIQKKKGWEVVDDFVALEMNLKDLGH